jgi:hypothetical protein
VPRAQADRTQQGGAGRYAGGDDESLRARNNGPFTAGVRPANEGSWLRGGVCWRARGGIPGRDGRIPYRCPERADGRVQRRPTGIAEVRITEDGQSDNAAFSPDGTRLAYSSGDDILIADQYGNDAQLVVSTGQGVEEIDWSPDGARLVTALTNCAESDCEYDIYTVGIDGTGLTNLTNSIFSERSPAWSPDGSLIAFDSIVAGERDVYTVHPDGTGLSNLTDDLATPASEPDFSPDGSRIVFEGSPNSRNPDGSGKSSIFSGARPAWSPDGARIGLRRDRPRAHHGATFTGVGAVGIPDWQVRPPEPVPQRGIEYPRPGRDAAAGSAVRARTPSAGTGRTPTACTGPARALHRARSRSDLALTVGTPDSVQRLACGSDRLRRFASILGNPTTPEDERTRGSASPRRTSGTTISRINMPITRRAALSSSTLRTTDFFNAAARTGRRRSWTSWLRVVVPCAAHRGSRGRHLRHRYDGGRGIVPPVART